MRYLEQCLSDLKSAHAHCGASTQPQLPPFSHLGRHGDDTPTASNFRDDDVGEDSDEEMSEAATSPHSIRPQSVHSHQPSISPAILPSAHTSPELMSKPSKFGDYNRSAYQSHTHSARSSALPSPAFEPQTQASGPGGYSTNFAPLTSPALGPQRDTGLEKDDHEATAALLMLNTDRRSWSSAAGGNGSGGRSMSVRDLLSG